MLFLRRWSPQDTVGCSGCWWRSKHCTGACQAADLLVSCGLQITDLKLLTGNKNRYECKVSDGSGSISGFTSSDVGKLIAAGQIRDGGIVCVTHYACNAIGNGHKLVIAGAFAQYQTCCTHCL